MTARQYDLLKITVWYEIFVIQIHIKELNYLQKGRTSRTKTSIGLWSGNKLFLRVAFFDHPVGLTQVSDV